MAGVDAQPNTGGPGLRWLPATMAGFMVGGAVAGALVVVLGLAGDAASSQALRGLTLGGVLAAGGGMGQMLVLPRNLNHSGLWAWIMAIVMGVMLAIGFGFSPLVGGSASMTSFIVAGVLIGLLQWQVILGPRATYGSWWVVSTTLGVVLAFVNGGGVSSAAAHAAGLTPGTLAGETVGGAAFGVVFGLVYGIVTGIGLAVVLRRPPARVHQQAPDSDPRQLNDSSIK